MKILIFGATWCSSCKALWRAIEADGDSPHFFEYLDLEQNSEAAQKYGVRSLLTVVEPEKGIVGTGITTLPALKRWISDITP